MFPVIEVCDCENPVVIKLNASVRNALVSFSVVLNWELPFFQAAKIQREIKAEITIH